MSIPPGRDTEKSSMGGGGGGLPLLNGIAHCSVDINHTLTDWFDVNNGVKQGCTVKPLITDPPRSGQPLYSGRLTCPRLILP